MNFVLKRGVHISAAHILGKENIIANLALREFQNSSHNWMLLMIGCVIISGGIIDMISYYQVHV